MEHGDSDLLGTERELADKGGIITARGTGDGLVIRLDGRVDKGHLKEALIEFMNSRKGFLAGNSVALEWVGLRPDDAFVEELSENLTRDFDITIRASRLRESAKPISDTVIAASPIASKSVPVSSKAAAVKPSAAPAGRSVSLFDGIEALGIDSRTQSSGRGAPEFSSSDFVEDRRGNVVADAALWDDPDARIVYSTLRSGQKIETEHSLVVFGDVNSGAELIAGGDIIVLGTLRGVAHAGAYDETGGGRVIFALDLRPTQLRIGMVISRGSSSEGQGGAELARVDGSTIVVEPYLSKSMVNRRRL
ncbi:MAG: septum site-determining protein MinC [Deltaproteobacteria bacterium]|nr:septum site-determining protein MinC [Deltaproteobacteria bacterium]